MYHWPIKPLGLTSEKSCAAETVVAKPRWVGCGGANHYVVEQLDVEGSGRLPELACDLHVCARRCRVTRWVIADTGDSGCSMLDCTPEHLAWMGQRAEVAVPEVASTSFLGCSSGG